MKDKKILLANLPWPWIIIGIGIILRLVRYFYNPSLWFDESDMAIDLISRPFSEIINPSPDYTQAYPYAFLVLIKFFTHILGNSEYVLRLLPLLSGILALFLFYKVAKLYIDNNAVLIALALFAISDPLIYQSSFALHPYSSDVFFALFIYALTHYIYTKGLNVPHIILGGIAGAVVVWFSTPSVLVMAGIGSCMLLLSINKKEWRETWKISIVLLIWILSFIANYFIYIQKLKTGFGMSMELMLRRENAYMPIPPVSVADIKWFIKLFLEIFDYPLEIAFTGIALFAFIIGCVSMYSHKRKIFFILISPLMFAFLAGALRQYPFRGRFIFFLVPSLLIIIAEGAEYIRNKTTQNSRIIGLLFIVLLLFQPLTRATYRVIHPFAMENIRPVLKYVKDNWQDGDILYVHYYAEYPFKYYSEYYPEPYRFNKEDYIIGIAPRGFYRHWRKQEVSKYYAPEVPIEQSPLEILKIYANDLDQLKGHERVWILFTSAIPKDGIIEEKFYIYHLESIGKQMDFFGYPQKTTVYLYDLSSNSLSINNLN